VTLNNVSVYGKEDYVGLYIYIFSGAKIDFLRHYPHVRGKKILDKHYELREI